MLQTFKGILDQDGKLRTTERIQPLKTPSSDGDTS